MKLTPLHIALGVNNGDLSIELIREACAQGAEEREELDWKRTLPLTIPADNTSGRNEQQNERRITLRFRPEIGPTVRSTLMVESPLPSSPVPVALVGRGPAPVPAGPDDPPIHEE